MTRKILSIAVLGLALFAWQLTPTIITSAKAETETHDGHGHGHGEEEGDNHEEGHDEGDGDDHGDEHSEGGDSHDEHGHDSHEKEDSHDDHGHGGEAHGDEHGDSEEHEEGKTEISADAAKKAGISIEKTAPAMIGKVIALTGRVTINQNTKAEVRARFPGIIRSVKANLGEQV